MTPYKPLFTESLTDDIASEDPKIKDFEKLIKSVFSKVRQKFKEIKTLSGPSLSWDSRDIINEYDRWINIESSRIDEDEKREILGKASEYMNSMKEIKNDPRIKVYLDKYNPMISIEFRPKKKA
jgi:hypothetical protein